MRVKELADELHITPQAIQKRMSSIKGFKSKYTKKVSNRIEISAKGAEILRDVISGKEEESPKQHKEEKTDNAYYRDELIKTLKDTVESQKTIIDSQTKQISKLEDLLYIEKTNNQVKDNRLIEMQNKKGVWSTVKGWFK